MTPNQSRLYYSLAEMFNAFGQMTSGLMIGRFMDRTRNLKLTCLLILCATIVGNLLYSLPFHISFILIGRFLCGFNEAFQVALCGEFKRCYKEDDLIRILSWYELFFAIGMAVGPGAPVIFSWVNLKIGHWWINKYNALHVFLTLLLVLLLILLWFQLTDLSKDLDCMKEKHLRQRSQLQCKKDEQRGSLASTEHHDNERYNKKGQSRKLMKWKELLQIDIITLCGCYTILRYAANASAALIAMDATTLFHWPVSWISWLTIAGAGTNFLGITMLIKCGVFKGIKRNYFCFLSAINTTMFILALMLLPKIT
uniref:Major facilitator superfamily (MFS) profile domain-containing protein n=2 Tax=Clytia hemisphaerica TaxID=252671 RepID=A0A7M5XBD5_9CNID